MKYKILRNDTGITNSTISRYIIERGEDYVKSVYGDKIHFIDGDEAKEITAKKQRAIMAKSMYKSLDNRINRYKGSVLSKYYVKIGCLQKMADILGVSRQRVHQIMTTGVHHNKIGDIMGVLDRYIEEKDLTKV